MNHHFRREQRRAKIIALLVAAVILAITVPLVASASLRLRVAERLDLVAEHPQERLFGTDAAVELIILTEEVPVPGSVPSRRLTAVYIAERLAASGGGVRLHDLARRQVIDLPLADYTLVAAAADRSAVLFVDDGGPRARAVLVTVATGEIRALLEGQTDPGIPGDWTRDVAARPPTCGAISPSGSQVACLVDHPWILGDWELSVFPYGRAAEERVLLRGLGSVPVLGWAADESALYYQNERGVWRVCLTC